MTLDIPSEPITGKELASFLGVGPQQVTRWKKEEGCPSQGKKYNLLEVCRWVLANKSHQSKARIAASSILNVEDIPRQGSGISDGLELKIKDSDLGLDEALQRLRFAEVKTHQLWQQALAKKDPDVTAYFRAWQNSLELLRKAEASLLDVLKERRELLPTSEVKTWLAKKIEMTKGRLLEIPAKVAPMTEDMEWPEVQKLLQQEIYEALEYLANDKR